MLVSSKYIATSKFNNKCNPLVSLNMCMVLIRCYELKIVWYELSIKEINDKA